MTTLTELPNGPQRRLFVVAAIAAVMLFGLALYAWSQGVDSTSLSIGAGVTDARAAGSSYLSAPNTH